MDGLGSSCDTGDGASDLKAEEVERKKREREEGVLKHFEESILACLKL